MTLSGEQVQQSRRDRVAAIENVSSGHHRGYERAIAQRLRHWEQLRSGREATADTTTTGADSTTSDDT